MDLTTMRPDDRELLRRAMRTLRQTTGASVVFGGLRSERSIRVSVVSGARTDRLSSIEVQPAKGLGGISWETGRPETVDDYGRADAITHHYDPQILGEGIRSLAVAPILVGGRVRGLIYAGNREPVRPATPQSVLLRIAAEVAEELRIRDLVDERVEMQLHHGGVLRAQLRRIAEDTTDVDTARRLAEVLGEGGAGVSGVSSRGASGVAGVASRGAAAVVLTDRQRDVLSLVAYGLTNAQIATRLGLSELTVKSYLRAIMTRLSVGTRSRAVVEARRRGLIDPVDDLDR